MDRTTFRKIGTIPTTEDGVFDAPSFFYYQKLTF